MTNKEAQLALANLKRYISGGGAVDRGTNKAIDMAIEALGKPEPHWIPVTVEPTDRMICYVILKDTNDKNRQNWVAEVIYTPWDGFDLMDGIEAMAWMPKQYPEAYKGANT